MTKVPTGQSEARDTLDTGGPSAPIRKQEKARTSTRILQPSTGETGAKEKMRLTVDAVENTNSTPR